jgi:D-alanyl-D-alanine carboxypeptidase
MLAPLAAAAALAVSPVTAADLGASYHPGCPVAPSELRLVQLRYWGFDGRVHDGELVVNRAVVAQVQTVFSRLLAARFPIRRVETIDAYGGSDERSMAADNTSAFNCRFASAPGPKHWSMHAYGKAIDVNPVENPYVQGSRVSPRAGVRFLDRARAGAGMAVAGGVLVRAFDAVGWGWGGRWSGGVDYQHFSTNGR